MRTPHNERLSPDIVEERNSPNSGSERRCVLSGEMHPRDALIRLAISPPDEHGNALVLPDPHAKAPGRGAWIVPNRAALQAAINDKKLKPALMRAFKGGPNEASLSYSDELPQLVETALAKSLLDRIGLELRGGNIILGSAKLEEHARTGRIALLLHARDSSEDGRKKLDQAWRVGSDAEGTGMRGTVLPLDRDALSVALGRENVVHLGVSRVNDGRGLSATASSRVGQAVKRLSQYVGDPSPD